LSLTKAAFDKTSDAADNKDIAVTLTKGSYTLVGIKVGTVTLTSGTDYTVSGDIYTIKKEYLNTLAAGSHVFTFDMSGGTDPTLTVEVKGESTGGEGDGWVNSFKDVHETDWFYEDVKYNVQNGLFTGTSADEFSPNLSLTRGMFVTVLARLDGQNTETLNATHTTSRFTDINAGSYYLGAIEWGADNKIVLGVSTDRFEPDRAITRQEMALILIRYADYKKITLTEADVASFIDEAKVADWALDAVKKAQKAGLIRGKTGNLFDPLGTATRAEAATVIHRFDLLAKAAG
jgi:hypothetical protein